jgi:hypothetical protein
VYLCFKFLNKDGEDGKDEESHGARSATGIEKEIVRADYAEEGEQ